MRARNRRPNQGTTPAANHERRSLPPNWIRDAVMATPPSSRCAAGRRKPRRGRPYVADVFDGAPWFDDLILLDRGGPWSRRWPAAAWKLRRQKIDVAVLFPNSFRVALAAWLGRCRRRIGFRRFLRGALLTDRLEPLRDADGGFQPTPIIDDYNCLAMTAGATLPGTAELFTTPRTKRSPTPLLPENRRSRFDLCQSWAARAGKHWYAESFATLGTPGRRATLLSWSLRSGRAAWPGRSPRLRARSASPGRSAALWPDEVLSAAVSCFVTDSGPRHFAAAFDRPVTLFGPTHIA